MSSLWKPSPDQTAMLNNLIIRQQKIDVPTGTLNIIGSQSELIQHLSSAPVSASSLEPYTLYQVDLALVRRALTDGIEDRPVGGNQRQQQPPPPSPPQLFIGGTGGFGFLGGGQTKQPPPPPLGGGQQQQQLVQTPSFAFTTLFQVGNQATDDVRYLRQKAIVGMLSAVASGLALGQEDEIRRRIEDMYEGETRKSVVAAINAWNKRYYASNKLLAEPVSITAPPRYINNSCYIDSLVFAMMGTPSSFWRDRLCRRGLPPYNGFYAQPLPGPLFKNTVIFQDLAARVNQLFVDYATTQRNDVCQRLCDVLTPHLAERHNMTRYSTGDPILLYQTLCALFPDLQHDDTSIIYNNPEVWRSKLALPAVTLNSQTLAADGRHVLMMQSAFVTDIGRVVIDPDLTGKGDSDVLERYIPLAQSFNSPAGGINRYHLQAIVAQNDQSDGHYVAYVKRSRDVHNGVERWVAYDDTHGGELEKFIIDDAYEQERKHYGGDPLVHDAFFDFNRLPLGFRGIYTLPYLMFYALEKEEDEEEGFVF